MLLTIPELPSTGVRKVEPDLPYQVFGPARR